MCRFINKYVCQTQSANSQEKKQKFFNKKDRYLFMMRKNIKNILREFIEDRYENDDLGGKADYMQKKIDRTSKFPKAAEKVSYMKDKIEKQVKNAYEDITGEEPVSDDNIVVKVDDNIKDGKIGAFKHPENKEDLGVMKIHPKALNDPEYVKDIIKHELIHAAHGVEDEEARNHGGVFQQIADRVGLPKKYRH